MLSRREFSLAALATTAAASAAGIPVRKADDMQWHDVSTWGVEGKGWADTTRYFDRLPSRAEAFATDNVWHLSRFSAGMSAFFRTNASNIDLRFSLRSDRLAMPHMPAAAVSGIDLYGRHNGRWIWAATAAPDRLDYARRVAGGLDPAEAPRDWRLYLPLFNGIEKLQIGVPTDASFEPVPPRDEPPIAFYGTSILHGSGASRCGMGWPQIVGRRLDLPILNLGFSGSARMEPELAELFAELDARAFVLDCAPNMWPAMIDERAETFVRVLREAHPTMPIVIVEGRRYGYAWLRANARERNAGNSASLRRVYDTLTDAGLEHLHYVDADSLPADGDTMVDGSHPNDLGMTMYADALTPVLREAMG